MSGGNLSKTWRKDDDHCKKHESKRSLREVARHGDEVKREEHEHKR